MREYVITSLENHLFFGRIMKEHALFLVASFPSCETNYIKKAAWYREQFEAILESVVRIANGNVREAVLTSGEVFTEYTEMAEHQTQKLTGIPIDIQITRAEKQLQGGVGQNLNRDMLLQVRELNQNVIQLLNGLIALKESIIKNVSCCNLYTSNYPLLVEHILREAKWYRQTLINIENGRSSGNSRCRSNCNCMTNCNLPNCNFDFNSGFVNEEMFWNQIMMEHAQFIRGLLDPREYELMDTADGFAKDYGKLLEEARQQDCRASEALHQKALETTVLYRDFKTTGTKGITDCQIRSVILPLLADHVLREANHYLRILRM